MSISFGGVITRYISTSTKLKLKSNVVDICEWYRNVCVVQSCMHWDIPNRVPVVPVPIPTPSPLFLSPFPSPSPCYKISLTQCTNHQIISQYFSLANVYLTVCWLFHNIKLNIKVPKEVHSLHCTVYNVHFQSSPWSKSKSVQEEQSIHCRFWQLWPTFFQCTTSQRERPLRWGTSGWHSQKPSGNTCHRK